MTHGPRLLTTRVAQQCRTQSDRRRRPVNDLRDTGAIDLFLIEAKGREINGALVPPLLDLVDRRLIRIIDVLVIVKREEGDFDALTTSDFGVLDVVDLGALAGASSGVLSADDAADAAAVLTPNSTGLLIIYENL